MLGYFLIDLRSTGLGKAIWYATYQMVFLLSSQDYSLSTTIFSCQLVRCLQAQHDLISPSIALGLSQPGPIIAWASQPGLALSNLSQSNLSQSNLSQSNLSQSNLSQSNLSQSNLSQSNLSQLSLAYLYFPSFKRQKDPV